MNLGVPTQKNYNHVLKTEAEKMFLSKCYVLYLGSEIYYKLLCLFVSQSFVPWLRRITGYKGAGDNSLTKDLHCQSLWSRAKKALLAISWHTAEIWTVSMHTTSRAIFCTISHKKGQCKLCREVSILYILHAVNQTLCITFCCHLDLGLLCNQEAAASIPPSPLMLILKRLGSTTVFMVGRLHKN